jgi:membrane-associated phospholipid phosphatase
VQQEWLMPLNVAAAVAAQAPAGPILDALAAAAALLLSFEAVSLYAAVATLVLWRCGAGWWSFAPFGFVALTLIEVLLKLTLWQDSIPREFYRVVTYPLLRPELPGSFPSGHALRTGFICLLLAYFLASGRPSATRVVVALAFTTLAVLLGLSRVYLGYHWLADVVGGLILGASLALVLAPRVATRVQADRQRSSDRRVDPPEVRSAPRV